MSQQVSLRDVLASLETGEPPIMEGMATSAVSVYQDEAGCIGRRYSKCAETLGTIEDGQTKHVVSMGDWSTDHMICWALEQVGPSKVTMVTWSVSTLAVSRLIRWADAGNITDFRAVLDVRARIWQSETMKMLINRFGSENTRTIETHAKVYVVHGGRFDITILSSANLSHNPRVEASAISADIEVSRFHRGWMDALWTRADPFVAQPKILPGAEKMPTKTLFLIRGLPGSGKSSLGKVLAPEANMSVDDFLLDQKGFYDCAPHKLKDANKKCMEKADRMMNEGLDAIAVHNTFSQQWEAIPYQTLAAVHGYSIFTIECQNDYGSSHGVPDSVIETMRTRWEPIG